MEKCLVTKLNGSSDNSELLKVGEMRMKISKAEIPTNEAQGFSISVNKPVTLEIIGEGYFTDKTLTENKGKTLVLNTGNNEILVSNNDIEIAILDKYSITGLSKNYQSGPIDGCNNISINLSDLKYSLELTNLFLTNTQVSGDIVNLKNLTKLTNLALSSTQVSGDIVNLKNLTELTNLFLTNTQVSGDIEGLKNLTKLTNLALNDTQVSGDIVNLKNLTELTNLYSDNCKVSGDIVNLKNLTKLSYMALNDTQVSGDIEGLKNLTELTVMYLNSSEISGDIEAFNGMLKAIHLSIANGTFTGDLSKIPDNCYFISFARNKNTVLSWTNRPSTAYILAIEGNAKITDVDKMLQDQAQCQVGITESSPIWYKTIECAGNRTSASDAAVATLQSKGYTVSITPA